MDEPPPDPAAGLSRRDFLKSAGLATAAATAASSADDAQAAPAERRDQALSLGPGLIPVRLLVNGTERTLRVEPRTTLAQALRDGLGLTGTKVGCDRGACGACTVWIDGHPAPACMTLCLDVAGIGDAAPLPITTIEGLAKGEALHPVQQAFIDQDALQCGFCTPGMVMSCAALAERCWARGAPATEDEARHAVAGNLCRCGAYPHVVRAAVQASTKRSGGGHTP